MKRSIISASVAIIAAALFSTSCQDVAKSIEDPAFAEWCRTNIDANGNGRISAKEAAVVEDINVTARGIASLQGIQLFPELKNLNCSGNRLTELDLSGNPKLVNLDCQDNGITSIIFAETDLETLSCSKNVISSLDVSGLKSLRMLFCGENDMETLILGEKPSLGGLSCPGNKLKELDLTACPALEMLDCRANELESLDVSANTNLTYILGVSYNNIKVLDLSNNADLKTLDCDKEVSLTGVSPEMEVNRH